MFGRSATGLLALTLAAHTAGAAQSPETFRPFDGDAYRLVNSIAFSPDGSEMYVTLFVREVLADRGQPTDGAPEVGLFRAHAGSSGWSDPELLPITGPYDSYEPSVAPDGSYMVFNSRRPWDDGRTPEVNDLWLSERAGDRWAAPTRIREITSFDFEESYPAVAANGALVYMQARAAPDGSTTHDLYHSRRVDGRFAPGERHPVSTDRWGEGDPWLSSDGRTLIYTRWDDEVGWAESVDLYISVLRGDRWSDPVPLAELNTDGADFGVAASADGRWLYYKNGIRFSRVPLDETLAPYRR